MAQFGDFFGREGDLLAAELEGFFDFDFLDGAGGVVGHLSGDTCCDLGFLAFEPDVAASVDGLPFEDYIAFHGDLEARADFKWDGCEECAAGDGFGVYG